MLPLLLPLLSLLWGVHTWSEQHKTELRNEHRKLSAFYGNPFLLACDELQSRIYNLLAGKDTFPILRAHYPTGEYADETLYLVMQYFGWERHIFRYGPYSQDAEVIAMTARIRDAFATAQKFPASAFCFFRTEQRALGEAVIEQVSTEAGATEETISLFQFRQALLQPPWSETRSVKVTLEALRNATSPTELVGAARLALVQNHLVDLVIYLEGKLGVSLVPYVRGKVPLDKVNEPSREPVALTV